MSHCLLNWFCLFSVTVITQLARRPSTISGGNVHGETAGALATRPKRIAEHCWLRLVHSPGFRWRWWRRQHQQQSSLSAAPDQLFVAWPWVGRDCRRLRPGRFITRALWQYEPVEWAEICYRWVRYTLKQIMENNPFLIMQTLGLLRWCLVETH